MTAVVDSEQVPDTGDQDAVDDLPNPTEARSKPDIVVKIAAVLLALFVAEALQRRVWSTPTDTPLFMPRGFEANPLQGDYFWRLGIPPDATVQEVKEAFRALARRYHPDVNRSPEAAEMHLRVQEAYSVLHDEEERHTYFAWHQQTRLGIYEKSMAAAMWLALLGLYWDGAMRLWVLLFVAPAFLAVLDHGSSFAVVMLYIWIAKSARLSGWLGGALSKLWAGLKWLTPRVLVVLFLCVAFKVMSQTKFEGRLERRHRRSE